MRRGNDWERRYGRRRRAIDRALLEAVERQIGLEELVAGLAAVDREELERRERLARAFGRRVE
ncbi:MAG TPA: hypothetical protein VGG86_14030 [Roseiarcus sp.]|jgi:hypothetical protein